MNPDAIVKEAVRKLAMQTYREVVFGTGEFMEKEAIKFDTDKIRVDLLPICPLMRTAKVLTFGAKKYSERNWELGFDWSRPYGALLRHMFAWWGGEDKDPETGLSHLDHAACCIMFLQEFEEKGIGNDNRPTHL